MAMKTRSAFTDLIAFFGALAVALAPYRRWLVLGLVLLIVLPMPFLVKNFFVFQLTLAMVYAIAILGLNLLTGFNGQFSLGHSAFYAIGAYTAAILMDQYDVAYYWTLPIAGIICFVAGFLFGLPALRLEGIYLALATFALAVAMPQILKLSPLEHWTGGVQGIVILKPNAPFGLPLNPDQWLYYFTFAVMLALFLCAYNLRFISRSPSASAPCIPGSPARSAESSCSSWRPIASPLLFRLRFSLGLWSAASARSQAHCSVLGSCCLSPTSPNTYPRASPARSMV